MVSASVADVRRAFAEQHRENREKLETIRQCVEKIEADMKPLGRMVATMEPIVAGYAVTRWKIAGGVRTRHEHYHRARMGRFTVRRKDRCMDCAGILLSPVHTMGTRERLTCIHWIDRPSVLLLSALMGVSQTELATASEDSL